MSVRKVEGMFGGKERGERISSGQGGEIMSVHCMAKSNNEFIFMNFFFCHIKFRTRINQFHIHFINIGAGEYLWGWGTGNGRN